MEEISVLNKSEIYRYLGYDPLAHRLTPEMEDMADGCIAQVLAAIRPRVVFSPLLALTRTQEGIFAGESGLLLAGKDIAAHLEQCSQAVLLAVTVGAQLDALIRKAQAADMAKAVILDAAASVAAEAAAEKAETALRQQLAQKGLYLTGRYSPGYGDLPVDIQREVLRLTDAPRKIGLSVTASGIMTPRKSITAIAGVADIPVKGRLAGCETCILREKCLFRKKGTTCAI